ncbi:MAG: Nif3-like dinuclear metal center hexameric protein [Spirochaetaceae bacterium]|nr:MAG: Nif3-like dinuclear metal center hexameric protein [Spirochaetaceae bacterium]
MNETGKNGVVTVPRLDEYFHDILPIDQYSGIDSSRNGLQVDRRDQDIRRVAFAVDAALQVFEAALEWNADMLFVHHGLFWGREEVLTGTHYRRIRTLLDNDLALYAVHLPLDAHLSLGNNAGMAEALGLGDVEPFGLIKGIPIGVMGRFAQAVSLEDVLGRLGVEGGDPSRSGAGKAPAPLAVLPFGPDSITTVGLISGGAPLEVDQAIRLGLDLYITGDANHVAYHRCREAGINAIFAGHYATEVWGVQRVAAQLAADTGLETTFIDIPTGL